MPHPAPTLQSVFDHIDARADSFVARLMAYLRHPSISAHNIGIAEVASLVQGMLRDLGMTVEALDTPGHPVIMGRRTDRPGAPTLLLYGHYDVQPPEPLDAWISPPFAPEIRDGRIFARGAGDNKGQHLAQLLAIESTLAVHGALPCNVIVLLEGEEEIGSPHIAEVVRRHADRLRADLVITADGTLHPSGRAVMTLGVRGVVNFEIRARTARRDAHSGNFGNVMPNAAWALVHLLSTMKTPDGRITIDRLHDPVIPPTQAELEAMAALPDDTAAIREELGLTALDAPPERGLHERTMFHPTLTINGLVAGYGGPGSKTVLPASAVAKCDIRLVKDMTPDQAMACMHAHVARHGAGLGAEFEVVAQGGMLPSKSPVESPFTDRIARAIAQARGQSPLIYPSLGGSLPDYAFTTILGIPAFVVPYGNADEANHAPNENLRIDCFLNGIRTGAALLAEFGRDSDTQ